MRRRHSNGFTLVELVVAVAISSIVIVFASMFMAAPIDAYDAQNRRNVMMANASAAWPRMHMDLLQSLPNGVVSRQVSLRCKSAAERFPRLDLCRFLLGP